MLRLIDSRVQVGVGTHRSGWPYALQSLEPLFSSDAQIILDDFVERTFCYGNVGRHTEPWIGIFHHPPDIPDWYQPHLQLQNLADNPRWQEAEPHLRLIIGLGTHFTNWARKRWPHLPVVTLRHPTGRPLLKWSAAAFDRNPQKSLVQVGWFLRNTQAIYHVNGRDLRKVHLKQPISQVDKVHADCYQYYSQAHPERIGKGQVTVVSRINDVDFDLLLSQNVVFVELISAVANNTVIECIARNTPICINRHPGPEYYLGKNYPLFYDHFSQVPELLTRSRIMAAHVHIRMMDKSWIRGGMFREHMRSVCLQHVPECREFDTPVNDHPRFQI